MGNGEIGYLILGIGRDSPNIQYPISSLSNKAGLTPDKLVAAEAGQQKRRRAKSGRPLQWRWGQRILWVIVADDQGLGNGGVGGGHYSDISLRRAFFTIH